MSSEAILTAKNCARHFGGLAAVNNVSFTVNRGEIFGLIGPNGAGKTTMLNLIAGVFKPTAGEIWFNEHKISDMPTHRRPELGVARTFQIPQPLNGLTVLENVMVGSLFGRNSQGRSPAAARELAEEVLHQVGLAANAQRPVEQLNLAQRKRLELARALATQPQLLLLDEVMAGLNHSEVEFVMDLIRKLNSGGMTVVIVEHIMKVIMSISSRILVMHHGERIAEGNPAEITSHPKVIEAYLGSRYAASRAKAEGGAAGA